MDYIRTTKLKMEHLKLTSYLKMQVDLAAQVYVCILNNICTVYVCTVLPLHHAFTGTQHISCKYTEVCHRK